jgi:hypothetical protein
MTVAAGAGAGLAVSALPLFRGYVAESFLQQYMTWQIIGFGCF